MRGVMSEGVRCMNVFNQFVYIIHVPQHFLRSGEWTNMLHEANYLFANWSEVWRYIRQNGPPNIVSDLI